MITRAGMRVLLSGLLLVAAVGMLAAAEESELHRNEIGIQGGFFLPDQDVSSKDRDIQEIEPIGGLRFAIAFAKRFDWFIDAAVADINVNPPSGDVESLAARTGVDFYFRPHGRKVQWFVTGGLGLVDLNVEAAEDFERTFASLGVGQRVRLDHRANFRWELRGDQAFDDNDILDGEDISRPTFMVSLNWGLGSTRKDSDGDGVYDRDDDCPDTPRGAIVDERGCPKDSDGDGVLDGIDRCPDTPRGATVDEWGCPKDSDGDGVLDGIDRCPDTPRGVVVDEWGCPKDGDADGVWDGIDRCPDTPAGAPVRPDGCPKVAKLFTEEKKKLILEGVNFEFDKAVLLPESREILDRVAESLTDWPEVRVEVAGHTDWIGSDEYNLDLSFRRSQAVKDYLVGKGIADNRMEVRGFGESEPIADNATAAGRAKNRRTELRKLD